jgi:hypothetical protein
MDPGKLKREFGSRIAFFGAESILRNPAGGDS